MKSLAVCSLLLCCTLTLAAQTNTQIALSAALKATPAVGSVIDVESGRELAKVGATSIRSTPGSVLKPLFLAAALKREYVLPQTTVFCRRDLRLQDGHREWNLACTHPQTNVAFAAKEALAYSCNRYFADLADRTPPGATEAILHHYALSQRATPQSREQKVLLVLGLDGIVATPAQIAAAYRKLALDLNEDPSLQPVREGLKDSVTYGMAHNATVAGTEILGKTGTASDIKNGPSHGWFAGIAELRRKAVVIVIYLPRGNGADAARLAQHFIVAAASTP